MASNQQERDRNVRLALIQKQFGVDPSTFQRWVESGTSADAAMAEALDLSSSRSAADRAMVEQFGVRDGQVRDFSITRAIKNIAVGGSLPANSPEGRVSAAFAEATGQSVAPNAVLLPLTARASVTGQVVGTTSLGGAGVQTSIMPFIDLLRSQLVFASMGGQVITGLKDNVKFPRQITGNPFTWTGENPSSANALTEATFDSVTMSPKPGQADSSYSRQLLEQAELADPFVAMDLARSVAHGVETAVFHGGGTLEPVGIFGQSDVGTVTFGAGNGAVPTWDKLVSFETECASSNAPVSARNGFVTTPGMRGALKTELRSTTAGSMYCWEGAELAGYPAAATGHIRSDFTTGTSTACHGVVFSSDWAQAILGFWGPAVQVLVNPYSYASQGVISVHAYAMCDVALLQPSAFTIATDGLVT